MSGLTNRCLMLGFQYLLPQVNLYLRQIRLRQMNLTNRYLQWVHHLLIRQLTDLFHVRRSHRRIRSTNRVNHHLRMTHQALVYLIQTDCRYPHRKHQWN